MRIVSVDELINYKILPFDIFNEKGKKIFESGDILTPGKILQLKYIQALYTMDPDEPIDLSNDIGFDELSSILSDLEVKSEDRVSPPKYDKSYQHYSIYDAKMDQENEISIVPVHTQKTIKNQYKEILNAIAEEEMKDHGMCMEMRDKILEEVLPEIDNIFYKSQLQFYGDYNYSHGLNVSMLSTVLAEKLKLSQSAIQDITLAGLLHDIGKTKIPGSILEKTSHSPTELRLIELHPRLGYKIITEDLKLSDAIAKAALQHHERSDGSGYPYGISSESITTESHIIIVCNVYDDLTSGRGLVKVRNPKEAIKLMLEIGSKWFRPDVLYKFVHMTNYNDNAISYNY